MSKLSKLTTAMSLVKKMRRNEKGTVAMMLGVSMIPIAIAVGVAVDHGNQIDVLARLQASTDAAILAAGRDFKKSEEDLQVIADSFFKQNFGTVRNASGQTISLVKREDCIHVHSEVKVKNLFMKLVDQDKGTLKASAEVCSAKTGMELVLVFDNTGSMSSYSRLATLKTAATYLTNILYGKDKESETLKIGVVPFSQAVNVGVQNMGKSWLDRGGKADYSKLNFKSNKWHNWKAWNAIKNREWNGCVEARKGDLAFNDTAPTGGNTLFTPLIAPDEPGKDVTYSRFGSDTYYNSYLSDGSPKDTSMAGLQANQSKYKNKHLSTHYRGPGQPCTIQPITPLTGKKQTVLDAISSMRASGYTHIAEGVAWGMRVISPGEPFTEGGPYNDPKMPKVMILLTDGSNTFQTRRNHNKSTYTAYGYLGQGRLGTTSYGTGITKQNNLVRKACDYAQKQGIIIYSFAYQVRNAQAKQLIKDCASDPEKYFDPPTNTQLVKYFEEVADELRNLYLSK